MFIGRGRPGTAALMPARWKSNRAGSAPVPGRINPTIDATPVSITLIRRPNVYRSGGGKEWLRCCKALEEAIALDPKWKLSVCAAFGGDLEHSLDGDSGALDDFRGKFDTRAEMQHAVAQFLERVKFHVFALAAAASVSWHPHWIVDRGRDEFLAGTFFFEAVQDAGLGNNDEPARGIGAAVFDHFLG